MKLDRRQRAIEMVMLRYGMTYEVPSEGEHAGETMCNFKNFDREGFKRNGDQDIERAEQLVPVNTQCEYRFTSCTLAPQYRAAFLAKVHSDAAEQGKELPPGLLDLLQTAYNHGFDDCGNMIFDILGIELPDN